MVKKEFIALRTKPEVKKALAEIAKKEFRTLSQQAEMIIIKWLEEHGYLKDKVKE